VSSYDFLRLHTWPLLAEKMSKCVIIASIFLSIQTKVAGQADGNPHNWDRRRRCDHTDYDPPCGVCEGYGGIPTGNDNDEITLTTCVPVASANDIDPKDLIKPVWGPDFGSPNYNEILIGPKTDPFCFQTFPSNSSDGDLCYRHDSGSQQYYMSAGEGVGGLYEELTLDTSVGEIESKLYHQGQNFWVVNHFPWYALGIHQCICTHAREGGDKTKASIYPVQYNWTQQMFYIGRETIGIEYVGVNMTLDHWAFGPHHVWSHPSNGSAIRMWQPFNGLQIFPNGCSDANALDKTVFDDIPPALCKKGGATFRIKCDDDGYSTDPASAEQKSAQLAAVPKASSTADDIVRAEQPLPGFDYRGPTFEDMSHTLNKYITLQASVKHCDDWNAKELQQLSAMLFLARDPQLDAIYAEVGDNRQLRGNLTEMQATWAQLNALIEGHVEEGHLHEILRDSHCHEAVMWYVHHLSADVKAVLAQMGTTIPLLSYESHMGHCNAAATSDLATVGVCKAYAESVTCASCHSGVWPLQK